MHAIVFSPDVARVRTLFADVLNLPSIDADGGWLILALPPAKLAVHPANGGSRHELYLTCDDIHAISPNCEGKAWKLHAISQSRAGACWRQSACQMAPISHLPAWHPSPLQV